MTNKDVLRIAMQQSAEDIGCDATDFLSGENKVVPFKLGDDCKKYYELPIGCNFISYGNNVVAAATEETYEIVFGDSGRFSFSKEKSSMVIYEYHCGSWF